MSLSRVRAAGLLSLLSLVCAGVIPTQAFGQAGSLPSEPVLNRVGLTRPWWSHATLNRASDTLLHMTADEKHIFLQSSAGVISGFDAETGKHLWSRPVGLSNRVIFAATITDESLVFISGLVMFGIDKDNGSIAFEMNLPNQPSTSPVAEGRQLYFGCLDGSLYAYDLDLIAEMQAKGKLPRYSENALAWRYRTSRPIKLPPVPGGPVVAFASTNGSLYSLGIERRKLFFQFETDAPISAPMVRYGKNLLVASEDTNFYSLDLTNGRRNWEYTTQEPVKRSPVLVQNEVYLMPEQGRMVKLSPETGHPIWPQSGPRVTSFLAASTDKLYTVDRSNTLQILSREDARPLGTLPLGRFTLHLLNDYSDRIYVATNTGLVMCLHELGRDFPHLHRHPDRAPVLPVIAPEGEPAEPPAAADETQ